MIAYLVLFLIYFKITLINIRKYPHMLFLFKNNTYPILNTYFAYLIYRIIELPVMFAFFVEGSQYLNIIYCFLCLLTNISLIESMHISKTKICYTVKPSMYFVGEDEYVCRFSNPLQFIF